jgi:transcription elongation factor B subunit 1
VHLDKCCEYWYFNAANKENPNPEEFKFPVEIALELLIAADFLDCKSILLLG